MGKRLFDVALSALGLLLLGPVLLLLAATIKLDSPGPVFYRGLRVGLHGRTFRIYKFRSMIEDAEMRGTASTSATDTRITRFGGFLRRFKLDELPQLINVLKGDMSIVGPRPQVAWVVEMFTDEEKKVLRLRPGITDWASIRFHDEEEIIGKSGMADADEAYLKLIHPEKMCLQLKYLNECSLSTDARIIFETIRALLRTRLNFGAESSLWETNIGERIHEKREIKP